MKYAAIACAPGAPFEIEAIELPDPGPNKNWHALTKELPRSAINCVSQAGHGR